MSNGGVSRRALLRGIALAGGAVTLGGLSGLVLPPSAVAQTGVLPRLGTLSHGYPAALDTGRSLVVFGIGANKQAYHQWFDEGGGWAAWRIVPGSPELKSRPIPLLNATGALSLFVTDKDGAIQTGWQSGPGSEWWNWKNLGHPGSKFVEEPFPVLNVDNAMSLFARAENGLIYHTHQAGPGGNWVPWIGFPVGSTGRPWAVIGPSGGMVVFARGGNGKGVVHRWQTAVGSGFSAEWTAIPGNNLVNEDVSAVVGPTGAITVFAGSERGVEYTWQKSAGGDWRTEQWLAFPEEKILGRPSVVVGPTGGMALFAKRAGATEENRLIHRSQPSWGQNWHNWVTLDPNTTGEPSGVLGRDGRLSAFLRNNDGKMVHRMQGNPGGNWLIRTPFDFPLEVG